MTFNLFSRLRALGDVLASYLLLKTSERNVDCVNRKNPEVKQNIRKKN